MNIGKTAAIVLAAGQGKRMQAGQPKQFMLLGGRPVLYYALAAFEKSEVVKYFSQITQCFYNEDNTEEEVEQLGHKIMELYDEALIANQDEERYLSALKKDIEEFKEKKRTIVSYVPSSSVDVETFTKDGYDWARLYCIYGIKQDGLLYNSNIVFILKKDENSHYKIYGWKLVQKDN